METTTKSHRMLAIITLYDMHNGFFGKVLAGIGPEEEHNRLNTKANHIGWIAGSLVTERFELARTLGQEVKQETGELFANHKGIQDSVTYPSVEAYTGDWNTITPVLRKLLVDLTDEKLDAIFEMEGMKMTYYELITFMSYRESNCIGQLALWRRLLGLEAMKYE